MESGSAASIPLANATLRTPAWQAFAGATPECAGAKVDDTFGCLRKANLTTLLASWGAANLTTVQYPFVPVVDGLGGMIPQLPSALIPQGHFARIPFISGANLDEGMHGSRSHPDLSYLTVA